MFQDYIYTFGQVGKKRKEKKTLRIEDFARKTIFESVTTCKRQLSHCRMVGFEGCGHKQN